MELLCRLGGWPITLRIDEYSRDRFATGATAYSQGEAQPMLRAATRRAIQILRAGETLLIFPEAYTNVDVFPTPKKNGPDFLPFRPGFIKLAQLAERDGKTRVSIVPVGLAYERMARQRRPPWLPSWRPMWRITMRFGEAQYIPPHATATEIAALRAQVEREVQELSASDSASQANARAALVSSEGHGAR
jgi:putative membrane protein